MVRLIFLPVPAARANPHIQGSGENCSGSGQLWLMTISPVCGSHPLGSLPTVRPGAESMGLPPMYVFRWPVSVFSIGGLRIISAVFPQKMGSNPFTVRFTCRWMNFCRRKPYLLRMIWLGRFLCGKCIATKNPMQRKYPIRQCAENIYNFQKPHPSVWFLFLTDSVMFCKTIRLHLTV